MLQEQGIKPFVKAALVKKDGRDGHSDRVRVVSLSEGEEPTLDEGESVAMILPIRDGKIMFFPDSN